MAEDRKPGPGPAPVEAAKDTAPRADWPAGDPPPGRAEPRRGTGGGNPAADAGPNTTSRLRREIDRGQAGDKVDFEDPAAAPLGTDDEAAGTPNTPRQVEAARAEEVTRANKAATAAISGSGGPEPGALPLNTARAGMMGEAEARAGHDDGTYSAPSTDSAPAHPRTVADLQGQPDRPVTATWAVAAVVAVALVIAALLIL